MRSITSISVLMPTFNGAAFLERVLAALAAQELELPWDLSVIDSSSTDGTREILEAARAKFPVKFALASIHALEFDHGDTRNRLAAESSGDLLVFLTQDAIPSSKDWLATLAKNFDDERVAAAYCRNVPRADADELTRVFSANDPGYADRRREVRLPSPDEYERLSAHERRLLYNFNDVASAVRRDIWKRHPFPRTEFGEDLLLARAVLEAGYTVVYDADATVEHSHDYGPRELFERAKIDARFNAEWLDRVCVEREKDVETLVRRTLEVDRAALASSNGALAGRMARAEELRRATFRGLYDGGKSERRRPKTRVLEREALHVLFVVHGFPPDTWAGTEVYTLSLAHEMQRLGHRVSILARAPGPKSSSPDNGPPDFALTKTEFRGLEVWRMTYRLDHRRMRDSYAHPGPERAFAELVDRLRPDVVHFQHLLHFSANLVSIARDKKLATVLTLNDYWGLCARVQLVRPDGVRCENNQGLGCVVCLKHKLYRKIPHARCTYSLVSPLVAAAEVALKFPSLPSVKLERALQKRRLKLQRWTDAFRDIEARQDVVLGNMASADLVIAPSRFLREKYLESGRFESQRVVYSDYGMPTEHLRVLPKTPETRVRFGFVGSLVWYKGVDVLVAAMNRIGLEGALLNVFGDFAPEKDDYHAKLRELADAERVRFRGRFANEKLSEVYREIDVLVVPSVWFENSPLTIHEAFLLGTPVVASDIGGMKELVGDGVDGLHFAVGDADDLARKLERFVREPDLARRLALGIPRVKTIAENAREMEYRYRALASVVRT